MSGSSSKNVLQDEIERMVTLKVQQATEYLNAEISDLKQSNSELKNKLDDLKSKTDELEQYSRRSCVRISGAREAENENISEIVLGISSRIGANIAPSDIDRLHRVGRTLVVVRTKVHKERVTLSSSLPITVRVWHILKAANLYGNKMLQCL